MRYPYLSSPTGSRASLASCFRNVDVSKEKYLLAPGCACPRVSPSHFCPACRQSEYLHSLHPSGAIRHFHTVDTWHARSSRIAIYIDPGDRPAARRCPPAICVAPTCCIQESAACPQIYSYAISLGKIRMISLRSSLRFVVAAVRRAGRGVGSACGGASGCHCP